MARKANPVEAISREMSNARAATARSGEQHIPFATTSFLRHCLAIIHKPLPRSVSAKSGENPRTLVNFAFERYGADGANLPVRGTAISDSPEVGDTSAGSPLSALSLLQPSTLLLPYRQRLRQRSFVASPLPSQPLGKNWRSIGQLKR
jgi:hypothetical protein